MKVNSTRCVETAHEKRKLVTIPAYIGKRGTVIIIIIIIIMKVLYIAHITNTKKVPMRLEKKE